MDTNEHLRQRALRLVKQGVSQKVLAAKMEMAPSTFSKWLNDKEGIGAASVTALDGFNAYVKELTDALSETWEDPKDIRRRTRETAADRGLGEASAPAARRPGRSSSR